MAEARWEGRNSTKDVLREEVWSALETTGAGLGPVRSRIPNYRDAHVAAARLAELRIWQEAEVVKCNPDPAQAHVRLRALQDNKVLFAPVPELIKPFPFVRLENADLETRGVSLESVMFSEGFVELGVPVEFEEMMPFDLVVVGCVAVTRAGGRSGKGGGFADLELGIFRDIGLIDENTPVVTTVHNLQVVPDDRVTMDDHDTPLDWIVTPQAVYETKSTHAVPGGVDWSAVQADQFENIPFLRTLKNQIESRTST